MSVAGLSVLMMMYLELNFVVPEMFRGVPFALIRLGNEKNAAIAWQIRN